MSKKVKKKRSPAVRWTRWVFGTIGRLIASGILVCTITGCIVLCFLTVYILDYIGTLEDIDIRNIELNLTSIIYADDANGDPVEVSRIHGGENRVWVNYEEIPQHLKDAAVAAEDKRFWFHHGVDWTRTLAAAVNMLIPMSSKDFGGSTIDQQLIKNATDQWAPNVERKVKEIFSALKLEQDYDKTDILESYLNVAAFGPNINGVQAAANYYFNKDVKDLTLPESAAIVAMTQSPTANNIGGDEEQQENNKARREYIYKTMLEPIGIDANGNQIPMITQAEYDQAMRTEVKTEITKAPAQRPNSSNNWFVDFVIERVIDDLMEQQGISHQEASHMVMSRGLHIYTTMDVALQQKAEELFVYDGKEDPVFPSLSNAIYPESAFVMLDMSGQVKAIAGSNRPKQGDRVWSYASDEMRQPGSTMKPISPYLQALEKDTITWSTIYEDSPIIKPGTGEDTGVPAEYWPQNYYAGYRGNMTVAYAVQQSVNTVAVKVMKAMGTETSMRFLHDKCGVESIVLPEENAQYNDNNLSAMAIGGMTEGVTPLELAGVYQIHGNGGTFTLPTPYTFVYDSDGNVLLEAETTPRRVITKETATVMNRMLQTVCTLGTGTAARFQSAELSGMPVAGKTGTSNDNVDQWFVGVTPYYVGVVWMGYSPSRQPINYPPYPFPTPILWRNMMEPLHEGLEVKDFDWFSDSVVQKAYCAESGLLASADCPKSGSGWYKSSNIPPICTEHTGVRISREVNREMDEDDLSSSSKAKKVDRDEDEDESSSSSSSSSRSGKAIKVPRKSSSEEDW